MEPGKGTSERRKRPRSSPQLTTAASSCGGQKVPVTLCGEGTERAVPAGHGHHQGTVMAGTMMGTMMATAMAL